MKQLPSKRMTRQLQVVHQVVRHSRSHLSADEVYEQAERLLPCISLGTVYRNLQRLVEEGKISVFFLGDRIARYDPTTINHAHFICRQCGHVEDIFLNRLDQDLLKPDLDALTRGGYTIRTYGLALHGLCPACGKRALSGNQKSRSNRSAPRCVRALRT